MYKITFISIIILQGIQLGTSKPFLLNSLSSLLSASSSSATNPYSENIGTIPKPNKLAPLTEFDNEFVFPDDPTTTTESQPSFIQKKVSKIIQKLVTLSQITAILGGSTQESKDKFRYPIITNLTIHNNPTQPNVAEFARSNEREATNKLQGQPNSSENGRMGLNTKETNKLNFEWNLDGGNNESNVFEFEWTDKQVGEVKKVPALYGVPKMDLDQPLKINLKQNLDITDDVNDVDFKIESKSIPTTTALGTYVLELFASVIGLAVGATNHINHALNQNNTV